jgi:hypothetical protein
VPGVYLPGELDDLRFEIAEQSTEDFETRTRGLGNAVVLFIGNGENR